MDYVAIPASHEPPGFEPTPRELLAGWLSTIAPRPEGGGGGGSAVAVGCAGLALQPLAPVQSFTVPAPTVAWTRA